MIVSTHSAYLVSFWVHRDEERHNAADISILLLASFEVVIDLMGKNHFGKKRLITIVLNVKVSQRVCANAQ